MSEWFDSTGRPILDAVAAKQPAPQGLHTEPVCNCHDCTQARSVVKAGGLNVIREQVNGVADGQRDAKKYVLESLQALDYYQKQRLNELREQLNRIELYFQEAIAERLARIEQSQATLAGETMVLVLTKLLKLQGCVDRANIFLASLERRTSPKPKRKRR